MVWQQPMFTFPANGLVGQFRIGHSVDRAAFSANNIQNKFSVTVLMTNRLRAQLDVEITADGIKLQEIVEMQFTDVEGVSGIKIAIQQCQRLICGERQFWY
jgi:hypothetical protein